jgi:hypothetical protein
VGRKCYDRRPPSDLLDFLSHNMLDRIQELRVFLHNLFDLLPFQVLEVEINLSIMTNRKVGGVKSKYW